MRDAPEDPIPPAAPRMDLVEARGATPGTRAWEAIDAIREALLKFMAGLFAVPYAAPWRPPLRNDASNGRNIDVDLSMMTARLLHLVKIFGISQVALFLDTNRATISAFASGRSNMPIALQRRLLDLDYCVARAAQTYGKNAVRWLTGHEPQLGSARPVDVLFLKGLRDVIDVLERIDAGGFS